MEKCIRFNELNDKEHAQSLEEIGTGALRACLAHYKTWTFSDLVRALKSIKHAIKNTYCIVCQAAVFLFLLLLQLQLLFAFYGLPSGGGR